MTARGRGQGAGAPDGVETLRPPSGRATMRVPSGRAKSARIRDDSLARLAAASARHDYVAKLVTATKCLLCDFFGSLPRALDEVSNSEIDVFIGRAFYLVSEWAHGNARPDSVKLKRDVCAAIGFSRHKGYRCDRDEKTVAARLCRMRSEWQPKLGTTYRINACERFFMLELGCGTKSFDRYVKRLGVKANHMVIVTVDLDASRDPTWCEDITDFDAWLPRRLRQMRDEYRDFENFHYVHFSPDCRELSASKTRGTRYVAQALELVLFGMNLILRLRPPCWTLECSASGDHRLAKQRIMQGLKGRKLERPIHFCKCGGEGNFKPGDWWSSFPRSFVRDVANEHRCDVHSKCLGSWLNGGLHLKTSQNGRSASGTPGMALDDLMRFPDGLVDTWLSKVVQWLSLRPSTRVEMFAAEDEGPKL